VATVIYVYSGTGNSLWVARTLAADLGDAQVASMAQHAEGPVRPEADSIGLVFPVHIWGLPRRVLDFVRRLEPPKGAFIFAVAVNAGQVSRTLVQLGEELGARGLTLGAGHSLALPSNYIPWGGPGSAQHIAQRCEAARTRISQIAPRLAAREAGTIERGPLWQRVLFTGMYKLSFPQVPTMDKAFFADQRCNGCGTCAKVCPAGNITMTDGKPHWQGRCEQCLACLQWCPKEALQYGKKTAKYARYHHPEIKLADMLAQARRPR
jgi:ferredoxin